MIPSSEARLGWRSYLVLFLTGLIVSLVLVALEPVPGYMDADYYYSGSMRLAQGHGFTEAIVWNYLDHPQGLPHSSHSYWYPLASILGAGGMLLTGKSDFLSARIGFLLIASLAPLVIAALTFRLTRNRSTALTAGFLGVFSGFYLPFIVTTDNYGVYILVGAVYFLLLDRFSIPKSILLGLLAGLLNLARGDGLLWLPLTFLGASILAYRQAHGRPAWTRLLLAGSGILLAFLGYLAVMGAWLVRNLTVFGSLLPPGSNYVLWMTNYNQLYSFTPQIYTFQAWSAQGWAAILKTRLWALGQNLGTGLAAEGMIVLVPFILLGAWKYRNSFPVRLAGFGWLALLFAESFLFPFASVNGGFFHAGAAFQPLGFALAAAGLDVLAARWNRQGRRRGPAPVLFQASLILVMLAFSGMLVKMRVIDSGWNEGEYLYRKADVFLVGQGAQAADVVMTRNPPAYYIMTGRQAIAIPFGDVPSLLAAARKFDARYVLLEPAGLSKAEMDLYNHPENYPDFATLGALDDNHILLIKPAP